MDTMGDSSSYCRVTENDPVSPLHGPPLTEYVPLIEFPDTVPEKFTVCPAPITAPKATLFPLTLPLIVPLTKQGEFVTDTVPLIVDPDCVMSAVTPPLAPWLEAHMPTHLPVRLGDGPPPGLVGAPPHPDRNRALAIANAVQL